MTCVTACFMLAAPYLSAQAETIIEEAPPPADTILLQDEAYVKGPKILLGDIAEIKGENADLLASIEISGAAAPGGVKRLEAGMLAARLKSAGVEPEAFDIGGARSVLAKTLCLEVSPDTVSEDLRRFIESQMPWESSQAMIDIVPPSREFVVPEGSVMIVWRPDPQYMWIGPGAFRGELLVDGEVKRTFFCKAQMDVYAEVLVAATDIPRGKPISAGDLDVQKRSLTGTRSDFLSRPSDAVGLLARSTIFPGQVITKRNVIPPKLVKRYQVVSVETRVGALLVRGRARAMADGRAGDIVPCRNEGSKEQFYGVVRDDGVIVVE